MDPSFQGLLSRVEVPDLLTFVNLCRRTGVLELDREGQNTRLFLREGQPVFANSDKQGLRLGDMLLRMGKVSQKDMDRCVARHRAGGHRLGQVLVAEGLLKEADLSTFLRVQVSEVVFDTFSWGAGRFAFYDDVVPPPDTVTLEMDIQNLLMEGVRRLDERDRLQDVFPDLDVAVEALANPERVRENLTLTPEEWQIFFLVDHRRTIREVCQLAGNPDELATLEILQRLLSANLIERTQAQAPVAPAEPAPDHLSTVKHKTLGPPTVPPTPAPDPAGAASAAPVSPSIPTPPRARERGDEETASIVSPAAVRYTAQMLAIAARLVIERDGRKISFPLSRGTYTLGRSPKNDIALDDGMVSQFHARVDRTREGFTLVDLKSTNGTVVNAQRVASHPLAPGDIIQVGESKLTYLEE